MKERNLIEALDACINSLAEGTPAEVCLEKYTDDSGELGALLRTAEIVTELGVIDISAESKAQNQKQILSYAKNLREVHPPKPQVFTYMWILQVFRSLLKSGQSFTPRTAKFITAFGLAIMLILFSGGILITSAKSLPGDSLYPVKLVVEDLRIHLAPSSEMRHEYEDKYKQQRVDEVITLMGLTREHQISFEGIITEMDGSKWIVSGIPVLIHSDTSFVGGEDGERSLSPGVEVEVEGKTSAEGVVLADEIHIREYQFIGIVSEINNDRWNISGIPLKITEHTQIDPGIRIGDEVMLLIRSEDEGIYALAILREFHSNNTDPSNQPLDIPSTMVPYEDADDLIITGKLDRVSDNYWIVNGEAYFLVTGTQFDQEYMMGDVVSIRYQVEHNGSYTAIEIKNPEDSENSEDTESQSKDEDSEKDQGESDEDKSPGVKETEEVHEPEKPEETPEPTESHPH